MYMYNQLKMLQVVLSTMMDIINDTWYHEIFIQIFSQHLETKIELRMLKMINIDSIEFFKNITNLK